MTNIASMTGFAESTGSHDGLRWRWEAKSVNSRSLDLRLRPRPALTGWSRRRASLRPNVSSAAPSRFRSRSNPRKPARGLVLDAAALASAVKIAREVAAETGLAPARVDGLLALKGVIVADDAGALDPEVRGARDAAILESLGAAFDKLAKERLREGAKLAAGDGFAGG